MVTSIVILTCASVNRIGSEVHLTHSIDYRHNRAPSPIPPTPHPTSPAVSPLNPSLTPPAACLHTASQHMPKEEETVNMYCLHGTCAESYHLKFSLPLSCIPSPPCPLSNCHTFGPYRSTTLSPPFPWWIFNDYRKQIISCFCLLFFTSRSLTSCHSADVFPVCHFNIWKYFSVDFVFKWM